MKKILSCATVAILCCGANSSFGQMRVLGDGPTPAPILVAAQVEDTAEVDSGVNPFPIPNPFDFGETEPTTDIPFSTEAPPEPSVTKNDDDPSSLPVGRHHRRRNVVDTIVDYSALASVPDAALTPIDWTQAARTPNPIAETLLRQQCVNGLWAGYSAQRAAECAAMWDRINGCHSQCGVACSTCAPQCDARPINRYLAPSCDSRP